MNVAVLFARNDSIYYSLPGTDVYDIRRDARTFSGFSPVVAHPPCRAWGLLRHMANPPAGEKDLARWAVSVVRRNGGVLEHPAFSKLWPDMGLPSVGERDQFGGWTLPIDQFWFGHMARKRTFLYVVGVSPRRVPAFPLAIGRPTHVVGANTRNKPGCQRPEVARREREATPVELARWLLRLARRCGCGQRVAA